MRIDLKKIIFALLPKVWLSAAFGFLTRIQLPKLLNTRIICWFAETYGVNLSEASKPPGEYRSLSDFFVRDLKEGLRPIGEGIVSPVDGTLRDLGPLGLEISQVKGRDYSLAEFIGDAGLAQQLVGGQYANLYLSPKDYHHVHSPFNASLVQVRSIPGTLWPVNDWAIGAVDKLFLRNSRIVFVFQAEFGSAVLVMVGAYNVGDMRIVDVEGIPRMVGKGSKIGTFMLGSSVVLLLPPGAPRLSPRSQDSPAFLGQSL